VIPRLSANFQLLEDDFLQLQGLGSFDYIITLFFIDTSLNVIQTLEQIYSLLKPGGKWINLGPLLWTGGAQAALELSLDEVIALAKRIGFSFETESKLQEQRTIDCEYTADRTAMMSWVYHAEFWVAQKPLA
jgi:carnosine N-methyltransferase